MRIKWLELWSSCCNLTRIDKGGNARTNFIGKILPLEIRLPAFILSCLMDCLRKRVDQIISELIPKYFVMAKVGCRYNQKNVWLQWHKTLSTAGEPSHCDRHQKELNLKPVFVTLNCSRDNPVGSPEDLLVGLWLSRGLPALPWTINFSKHIIGSTCQAIIHTPQREAGILWVFFVELDPHCAYRRLKLLREQNVCRVM